MIKITLEYTADGDHCVVSRQCQNLTMQLSDIGHLLGLVLLACQGDIARNEAVTSLYDACDSVVGETDLFDGPLEETED